MGGLISETVLFIAVSKTRSETAIFPTGIIQRAFLNPEEKIIFYPSPCTVQFFEENTTGVVIEMGPKPPGGGLESNPLAFVTAMVNNRYKTLTAGFRSETAA